MQQLHSLNNYLQSSINITFSVGNIVNFTGADVIINPTNESLSHKSGCSHAIIKSANDRQMFQDFQNFLYANGQLNCGELLLTSSYNLANFKKIAHVCSPHIGLSNYNKKLVKAFKQIFHTCFVNFQFTSICMPFIGTGVNLMTIDECILSFQEAFCDFLLNYNPSNNVLNIHFVNMNRAELDYAYQLMTLLLDTQALQAKQPHIKKEKVEIKKEKDDDDDDDDENKCTICMDTITNEKTLDICGHSFCAECIDAYFMQVKKVCPNCGTIYGVTRGNQPPGSMQIRLNSHISLPGHEGYGTIEIHYVIPSGTQTANMPNPGSQYHGTQRNAYLPNSPEGNEVLALLKRAFDLGHIFTIGQSRTTGVDNVVTWNDIHHKTNVHGGPSNYGYPDPTYLQRVKSELEAKGIRM